MSGTQFRPRVGVGALSSPLEVGAERAPGMANALAGRLCEAGCEVVPAGPIDTADRASAAGRYLSEHHVDAVALCPVSWCEDYLVLDLAEECPRPVLFWPLPGMETGALCGTQQATVFLKHLGHPCRSVFGRIEDGRCLRDAMAFLRAAALRSRLRRARIGIAGHRVNGMTHTSPCEFMLKKAIGPRVVCLDLPELLSRVEDVPDAEALEFWRRLVARAGSCKVSDEVGTDAMKMYVAVRDLVAECGLDALTIGCYPRLMGRVCLAASLLADEGVPLACEGDVHGAVAQLALQLLTNQPTHNTDWLDPMEDGTVVFTHCGSGSLSLSESCSGVTLDSVRLMGQGACALYAAKPGNVTLLGFTATADGYQCALLEGEAVPTGMVFPGNPLRVRFGVDTDELIGWIHREGVGHHWMVGYGHVGAEIRAWVEMASPHLRLVTR